MSKELKGKKKIIAHRGLCDIFPQNSIESIEAGLFKADLVQFDVLLTKDNKLAVFHDRGLKRLTNIENFPEFSNRKRIDTFDGKQEVDWWLKDFTMDELKKLDIKQTCQSRPKLKQISFKIPTLQEVLAVSLEVKQNPKHPLPNSGLLIELKNQRQTLFSQRDTILVEKIVECLTDKGLSTPQKRQQNNLPLIVQSFCQQILQNINKQLNIPIVRLFEDYEVISYELLCNLTLDNLMGIGITECHLKDQNIGLYCQRMNLQIFYWTVRDDSENIPFKLNCYDEVYKLLIKKGIKGVITEFPQKCRVLCVKNTE